MLTEKLQLTPKFIDNGLTTVVSLFYIQNSDVVKTASQRLCLIYPGKERIIETLVSDYKLHLILVIKN